MKRAIRILFAILLVATLVVSLVACKDACADGHTWDDGEITTPADCEKTGTMTFTCTVCGETKEETIPASHQLGDWIEATETEVGHYHCAKCGKNFDADKKELTDITITPGPNDDDEITLYWTSDIVLPEYVSMYFCGGITNWTIIEVQYDEATNVYSVKAILDKSLENWNKYVIALGYNASSGLDEYGLDWNYKSIETKDADGTFDVADGAQSVDLGAQTFSSVPEEPEKDDPGKDKPVTPTEVQATFVVAFDAKMPEGYNVYLAGEMTNWGDNAQKMGASEDGLTYSVTLTLNSGTYKFKVVACKGAFSWTDTSRVEYGGSADNDGNAEVIVLATGGTVRLFASAQKAPSSSTPVDPTPSGSVTATFTITFDATVPDAYTIYLVGEMTNWGPENGGTPLAMTASSDGLTYSATLKLKSGAYKFKVLACQGSFTWDGTQYGGSADSDGNAQITVPATGGTVALFASKQKAPSAPFIPGDGGDYIFVGGSFSWDETSSNPAQYLTHVSGSIYTYDISLSRNDIFKIKPNALGYDGAIDGNATINVTFASGVTQVSGLFYKASSYDNIAVKFDCTVTMTVDVGTKKLDILVKSVTVVEDTYTEFILTGSMTGWGETTTNSEFIFDYQGNGVYKLTLSFVSGDIFKLKANQKGWNPEYGWHNENCQGGAVSNFQEGADMGNMMCVKACTVTITLNINTGVITFELA